MQWSKLTIMGRKQRVRVAGYESTSNPTTLSCNQTRTKNPLGDQEPSQMLLC